MFPTRAAIVPIAASLLLLIACAQVEEVSAPAEKSATSAAMDRVAESYVRLALAVGRHDPDFVDAYFGPESWREAVEAEGLDLETIRDRARVLIGEIPERLDEPTDELSLLRREYLLKQLGSLLARVEMLGGKKMTFDEESKALYDATAPRYPEERFQRVLDELASLLPGDGTVAERYERFRQEFIIPPEETDAVFRAAIEACRERTQRHLELPPGESFEVEYVTDVPWGAYNWYKGEYRSLIQVNTDLPIYIDRAVDLACHEGYPGHHVYNLLLEWRLRNERGWVEFSVYPLYSPQSLIAEGTANYGIEIAFPGEERVAFEKETLFPLAGLDPARADLYYEVVERVEQLDHAGNEAARRYLDGEIDRAGAVEWLTRYELMPRPRAEKYVDFIERYRSYVINYNLGEDLVREYIESKAGSDLQRRWEVFTALISSPRLPSGLE